MLRTYIQNPGGPRRCKERSFESQGRAQTNEAPSHRSTATWLRHLGTSGILAAGMGPATRAKGIRGACRCVVLAVSLLVAFTASAQAAPTSIMEYPVEVGHSTNIDHITAGPDGTVWFADGYWPEGSFHALIGRFDPADAKFQEFDEGLGSFSVIRDFVAGPDGNMWFANSGSAGTDAAIGKVTPAGQITEYASPVGG